MKTFIKWIQNYSLFKTRLNRKPAKIKKKQNGHIFLFFMMVVVAL